MKSFSRRIDIEQAAKEAVANGEIPTILAKDIRQARGTVDHVLVEIFCPYCWKRHTHGGEVGEAIGYRVAHCTGPKGRVRGYIIETE